MPVPIYPQAAGITTTDGHPSLTGPGHAFHGLCRAEPAHVRRDGVTWPSLDLAGLFQLLLQLALRPLL